MKHSNHMNSWAALVIQRFTRITRHRKTEKMSLPSGKYGLPQNSLQQEKIQMLMMPKE